MLVRVVFYSLLCLTIANLLLLAAGAIIEFTNPDRHAAWDLHALLSVLLGTAMLGLPYWRRDRLRPWERRLGLCVGVVALAPFAVAWWLLKKTRVVFYLLLILALLESLSSALLMSLGQKQLDASDPRFAVLSWIANTSLFLHIACLPAAPLLIGLLCWRGDHFSKTEKKVGLAVAALGLAPLGYYLFLVVALTFGAGHLTLW
jgi:hypothetical protein